MDKAKVFIIAIACGTAGFAAGFYSKQPATQLQEQIGPPPSSQITPLEAPQVSVAPKTMQVDVQPAVETNQQAETTMLTLKDCKGMIHQAMSSITTNKPGMNLVNPDYQPELQAVADNYSENTISAAWAKQHIQQSSDVIDQIASNTYKVPIKQFIAEESEFLQPREKKLPEQEDLTWATQKEIELRNIIESQNYAGFVTINQLTCKQLMCEIIATASDSDSWYKAVKAIHFNAANIIRPWERDEQLHSTVFQDEDMKYAYYIYEFTQ